MVQEKFRVRTATVVQFETPDMYELSRTNSTIVDIDGTTVVFDIDGADSQITDTYDRKLSLGPDDVGRLLAGFPAHFYSVLDGRDLVVMFEHRLDGQEIMEDRAGGFLGFEEFVEEASNMRFSEFHPDEVPDEEVVDSTEEIKSTLSSYGP